MTITAQSIYRAVAGAVKNAADAHPRWAGWGLNNKNLRASIAKRATGTLLAQLRDSVGGVNPSDVVVAPSAKLRTQPPLVSRAVRKITPRKRGRVCRKIQPFPIFALQRDLGLRARTARLSGDTATHDLVVSILRKIAELQA